MMQTLYCLCQSSKFEIVLREDNKDLLVCLECEEKYPMDIYIPNHPSLCLKETYEDPV